MYCMKCGTRNEEGVKFCPSCGAKTEQPAQTQNTFEPTVSETPQPNVAPPSPFATPPSTPTPTPMNMPQQQPTYYQNERGTNPLVVILPIALVLIAAVVLVVLILTGTISFGQRSEPTFLSEHMNDPARNNTAERGTNDNDLFQNDAPIFGNDNNNFAQGGQIPASGGDVQVVGTTDFTFTPRESGMWEFRTSNNNGDPLLEIYDASGAMIARDDDSGGDLNALIRTNLQAGETYRVHARFFSTGTGSYTLSVTQIQTESIPRDGGVVQVIGTTDFIFTPRESGMWEFRTSNNTGDPLLEIYDSTGAMIASDDDSGGDLNALIRTNLQAGETYRVHARFFSTGTGSYTLAVIPFTPASPSSGAEIPRDGGTVSVAGTTDFFFTPRESGMWEFRTSNNVGDPLLEIYDSTGAMIARDDDSGGDLNALIRTNLQAGEMYRIHARFFSTGTGSYTLTVIPFASASPSGGEIPRDGGAVSVVGTTDFMFTPRQAGMWEFLTSNNVGDPLLEIFDSTGTMIARDDDSGGNLNSLIRTILQAGETYRVYARFFSTGTGSYTLTVTPIQMDTIPSSGGNIQVDGETNFVFIPNRSGTWVFETTNNTGDPLLTMYDASGDQIARDDDGGEGLNAFISIQLEEGSAYIINAGFFAGGTGRYTLMVTRV